MKILRPCVGYFLTIVITCLCQAGYSQAVTPQQLKLKRTVRFAGSPEPVEVRIYELQKPEPTAVVELEAGGKQLGRANQNVGPLLEETGVYDITGQGFPEIVIVGLIGAKTTLATAYQFKESHLSIIGQWSGWQFKVEHEDGKPIVEVTPTQYGSLYDLYYWDKGKFRQCNECFPKLYISAIESQKKILTKSGLPAYVFVSACRLAATALVYGQRYDEAIDICDRAMEVVKDSSRLIPSKIGADPAELKEEQDKAEADINNIMIEVKVAKSGHLSILNLREPTAL